MRRQPVEFVDETASFTQRDWQGLTKKIEIQRGAPGPGLARWAKQHDLLCMVLAPREKARNTQGLPMRRLKLMDRVALMRLYVDFVADHNQDMARTINLELAKMSTARNRHGRKAHREVAWKLCVADASLRLPESTP